METGSNKGLFTLIAIVVFGIFLSLSYFLFQDSLKGVLADVMGRTSDSINSNLNITLDGKVLGLTGDFFNNETKSVLNYVGLTDIKSYNFAGTALSGYDETLGGLSFDGVDDYMEVNLNSTDEITVHFDIMMRDLPKTFQSLMGSEEWKTGIFHVNLRNNTDLDFDIGGLTPGLDALNVFEDGKRYVIDIVYSYTGAYGRAYINGVLVDEEHYTNPVRLITQTARIGENFLTESRYFGGVLYNLEYYERALSSEEINYFYQESLTTRK